MIVVHFAKVSILYPHVVISSLAKRLENLLLAILYFLWCVAQRSLHVVTKVYYRSWAPLAVLTFPLTSGPSCTMWIHVTSYAFSRTTEQDTLHIVFLISKQVVPYQTRDDTCCPMLSTHKTWSLADLSNHIL
jgi:hypothetical protein